MFMLISYQMTENWIMTIILKVEKIAILLQLLWQLIGTFMNGIKFQRNIFGSTKFSRIGT